MTHREISRTVDRVRQREEAGIAAMKTSAGRRLCELFGVEITSLERWDSVNGRSWYIVLAGQKSALRHKSHEFRTASSLNRLVRNWRRSQGNPAEPNFTSQQASHILALMHVAIESSDK